MTFYSALTANNAFAQKRLQKEGIYCLHTKHINLCGGIDVVAFDKVEFFCDQLKVFRLRSTKKIPARLLIILVTRSTSLGWSDKWISQPPWVSDQDWSHQRDDDVKFWWIWWKSLHFSRAAHLAKGGKRKYFMTIWYYDLNSYQTGTLGTPQSYKKTEKVGIFPTWPSTPTPPPNLGNCGLILPFFSWPL